MSDPSDLYGPASKLGSDPALREHAQYWIARLATKDISATELDALETWLTADPRHAYAFSRERALWQDLDAVADVLAEPSPALPFMRSILRQGVMRRRILRAAPVALAASLMAALLGPSLVLDLRADHRTDVGEVRSVTLPDGTTAMLDSATAISVAFDGDRRVVHLLAGRAWFNVHHEGRPFYVEAHGGETRDIGTAFEVRRNSRAVEVGVTQGAVSVRAPGGINGPTLHAGERVRYTDDGLHRLSTLPSADLASWRKGELLFDKQPVKAVITEIARYRGAPVWTFGDFGGVDAVSGLFLIERPDEALETLSKMRGLRITKLPGGILIIRPNLAP
ncbi:MAG: hypothetical protein BGO57_14915 [Sphingomonadales bacterium 63-6]|nr:MAG: hypothetical protein BGO57_14915 [Sphingomonadales bacterium 63-6]